MEKKSSKDSEPGIIKHGFDYFRVSEDLFPSSDVPLVMTMFFSEADMPLFNFLRITHWLRDRIRGGILSIFNREFFLKNRNMPHLAMFLSLSKNTLITYLSHLSTFLRYVLYFGEGALLPVDKIPLKTIDNFLYWQSARGIQPKSCQGAVSALKWAFELIKDHAIFSPTVKRTLRAISQLFGRPPKKARPLTGFILSKYANLVNWSSFKEVRRLLIGVIAWLGMLRRSEVAALSFANMSLDVVPRKDSDDVYLISFELEKTKTKSKSEGEVIFIGALPTYPIIDILFKSLLFIMNYLQPVHGFFPLFPTLPNLSLPRPYPKKLKNW